MADFPRESFFKSICCLSNPPWRDNGPLIRLYELLNREQADSSKKPSTLFVGGAVRNALKGQVVSDYDLATNLSCQEVMARAETANIKSIPTGVDYGTVTLVLDGGLSVEVTRLRVDIKSDGRHATVDFTDNWFLDAARRDFTMNALYADLSGHIFEGVAGALSDACAGRVRFIGNAYERILEDHLRILRFFRFHAWYGQGELDSEGLVACRRGANLLADLSSERVTEEFYKWLAAKNPRDSIEKAFKNKILNIFFDQEPDFEWFARLIKLQEAYNQRNVATCLLILFGNSVEKIVDRLRLSNNKIKELKEITQVVFEKQITPESLRRTMARFDPSAVLARYLMESAHKGQEANIFNIIQDFQPPPFPLSGALLKARGVEEGPIMGRALKELREKWILSDFCPLSEEDIQKTLECIL